MVLAHASIELHAFPSDDDAFRRFAEQQLAHLTVEDPERLQDALRARYPMAVVRARSELACLPRDRTLWYAFRSAIGEPPDERWWERGDAWAIIDAGRTFVEASEAFAAIVEVPTGGLIGQRIEELANPSDPTATEDIADLWAELLERREVHGTLRFNRLDGSGRELEYHVKAEAGRAGPFLAVVRERGLDRTGPRLEPVRSAASDAPWLR